MEKTTETISIGSIAEAVVITTALGFVVSCIYDFGFFYALNLSFINIPTTTADHFHTGLLWFPYLIAFIIVYFAIEYQFQRIERGLSEQEIAQLSKNPEWLKNFREGPYKLLKWWIAPLFIFNYILVGDVDSSILPVMLSIGWIAFAEWCYSTPLIQIRRSQQVHRAFTFLPLIFIIAFFSGYKTAVNAAVHETVKVNIEQAQGTVKATIVRTIEKGVLILNNENHVVFIPWDQIQAIENQNEYMPFRGVLCEWFDRCVTYKAKP